MEITKRVAPFAIHIMDKISKSFDQVMLAEKYFNPPVIGEIGASQS